MKNGQRLPEPTLQSLQPAPRLESRGVGAIPSRTEAPAPVTVGASRIDLVRPVIRLNANFSSDLKRVVETQSMNLTPERAYISHGCIFVDELKVWFPLNTVQIGRWS